MPSNKIDFCYSCRVQMPERPAQAYSPKSRAPLLELRAPAYETLAPNAAARHTMATAPWRTQTSHTSTPHTVRQAVLADTRAFHQSRALPEINASKYNFFRDHTLGNKIAGFTQALSRSTKDGVPYSHLGNFFPSNKDIQDGQFWLALSSIGSVVLRLLPALSRQQSIVTQLSVKKEPLIEKASFLGARINGRRDDVRGAWQARDQIRALDKKIAEAPQKMNESLSFSAKVQTNAVTVSASYGAGSNVVGGLPATPQTALGSGLIGLFLAKTAPHMMTKMQLAGYSEGQRMAALTGYRGLTWGLYGAAATGDVWTSLSMLAGGALLTRGIGPANEILKSTATPWQKFVDIAKVDALYLAPGVALTGAAKKNARSEFSTVISEPSDPEPTHR